MKVRTDVKQDAVQYQRVGQMEYVRLYLHETEDDDVTTQSEETTTHHWYEYDFKEICTPTGELDVDAIKMNPEDYLEYEPVAPTTLDDIQEAIMALQQLILGGNDD